MDTAVYSIVPASGRPMGFMIPLAVVLVVVFAVTGWAVFRSVSGARNATFELSPEGLRIRGDLWGRAIPASALRGAAARLVDLRSEPGLAPRRRTAGTAIPGYRSGWFRLASREKALLYLTTSEGVVYCPTSGGYSLLLSVRDPERFLAHLRRVAPSP